MEKLPNTKLKQQKSNLSEHNFIMRNLQPQVCYLFVPDTNLSLAHNNTPHSQHSHLSFNLDRDPKTPAFISHSERSFLSENNPEHSQSEKIVKKKQSQKKKVHGNKVDKAVIFVPEPGHKYCSVCRQKFDNYIRHINHPVHIRNVEQAQGTGFIQDLVNFVQKKKKEEVKKPQRQSQKQLCLQLQTDLSVTKQNSDGAHSPQFQSILSPDLPKYY